MDGHVLLLVLAAALLHATWNSIVKGGSNKLFESSMNALGGGLGALLILPFLPAPAPESWGLLALSCCFHLTYYICISQAYDKVDLSMGYTIMRGCAPMITALALLLLGNHISLTGWGGVLLLCLGILTLTLEHVHKGARAADIGPHGIEEVRQIDNMGFLGCVLNNRRTASLNGSQHNIDGGADGNDIQINRVSQKAALRGYVNHPVFHGRYLRAQRGKALEVLIDRAYAQLTAAGHGHLRRAVLSQQSADKIIGGAH